MTEQIMDMARSLGHVDGEQEEALETLYRAVQVELAGQLRPEMWLEDCGDTFIPVCAWLALAGLAAGGTGGGWFTAGEATIQGGDGTVRVTALHLRAETVLGLWLAGREFAFQGVPG